MVILGTIQLEFYEILLEEWNASLETVGGISNNSPEAIGNC